MKIFGVNTRSRPARTAAFAATVALVSLTAAVAVAVAVAKLPKHDRPPVRKADSAATLVTAHIAKAIKSGNPLRLAATVTPAPGRPSGRTDPSSSVDPTKRSRIWAAAVDWPYSYYTLTQRPVTKTLDSDDEPASLTIVRRNLVSGERKVLLKTSRSMVVSLHADGGRAYAGLIRFRGESQAFSSIVSFDPNTADRATIDSGNLKIDDESEFGLCGRLTELAGVDAAGGAIIERMTTVCRSNHVTEFGVELIGIDTAGAIRTLDPKPNITTMIYPSVSAAGKYLVEHGSLGGPVDHVNTESSEVKSLWMSGGALTTDVATDGTALVGPGVGRDDDSGFWESNGRNLANPSNNPFVLFPQGDIDAPQILTDVGYRTATLKFCGGQLYEMRMPGAPRYNGAADGLSVLGGLASISEFEVIARGLDGQSPRPIGTLPKSWVRHLSCDGETLVVATDDRIRVAAARFGP